MKLAIESKSITIGIGNQSIGIESEVWQRPGPIGRNTIESKSSTIGNESQQLGIHSKPCGLLNIATYYDPLFDFLQKMVEQEFLKPFHLSMMVMEDQPAALLQSMKNANVDYIDKWWK